MTAYLGIGSNLGDRMEFLKKAVRLLDETEGIRVAGVSPVYETVPAGGPPQGDYLNAAVALETSLEPRELMDACLAIEKSLGRVRNERWGPRIIDIDILLYGSRVISERGLDIPHPRMAERGFVLRPLADIAPDAVHPVLHAAIRELRDRIGSEGVRVRRDLVLEMPKAG